MSFATSCYIEYEKGMLFEVKIGIAGRGKSHGLDTSNFQYLSKLTNFIQTQTSFLTVNYLFH